MTVKKKMLINFGVITTIIVIILFFINFKINSNHLQKLSNIEYTNYSSLLKNQVNGIIDASIVNYLRSGTHQQMIFAKKMNDKVKNNELSLEEAQNKYKQFALGLNFGTTGYAYAINSKGILTQHPSLEGKSLIKYDFVKDIINPNLNIVPYNWKGRDKIVYKEYFKPWDWFVTASGYISEFLELVDVKEIKKNINHIELDSLDFAFIINDSGKVIVHPTKEGEIISGDFFNKIKKNKNGVLNLSNCPLTPDKYKSRNVNIHYFYNKLTRWYGGIAYYNIKHSIETKNNFLIAIFLILVLIIGILIIVVLTSKHMTNDFLYEGKKLKTVAKNIESGLLNIKIDPHSKYEDLNPFIDGSITIIKSFRALLNYTSDPMIIIDKNREVTFINSETEKYFNFDRHNIINKNIFENFNIPEDVIDTSLNLKEKNIININMNVNGDEKTFKYSSIPIIIDKKTTSILILLVDITEINNIKIIEEKINSYVLAEINQISVELDKFSNGNLKLHYAIDEFDNDTEKSAKNFETIERAIKTLSNNMINLVTSIKNNGNTAVEMSNKAFRGTTDVIHSNETVIQKSNFAAQSSNQVNENLNILASSVEEMSINAAGVAEQSEMLNNNMDIVSSSVDNMMNKIKEVTDNTEITKNISQKATEKNELASSQMIALGNAANEIGKVTDVIKRIAEQTNLLALNATIEAASAGEAGKGFAVVANEIKELANQSAKAAEDIAFKIENIQNNTEESIEVITDMKTITEKMADSIEIVSKDMDLQKEAAKIIEKNTIDAKHGVDNITTNITEIATGVKDAAQNLGEASANVQELSSVTSENSEITIKNTKILNTLSSMINDVKIINEKLKNDIEQFKID